MSMMPRVLLGAGGVFNMCSFRAASFQLTSLAGRESRCSFHVTLADPTAWGMNRF